MGAKDKRKQKMKKITFLLLIFPLVFTLTIPCFGESYKKLGTAGLKFLEIDPCARSAAMGGASNVILKDASAIFLNPAGLAFVSNIDFIFSYNSWIADINQYAFGGVVNLDKIGLGWLGGTLGASLLYIDNGEMIRTEYLPMFDDYYEYPDPYTIEEWAAGIAYARSITDKFSFGGHIKYAVQDFGNVTVRKYFEKDTSSVENRLSPVVLDFGTIYNTGFHDLQISMSFRNFAQEVIYVLDKFELPISMRIGIAMNVFKMSNQSLMIAIDAVHPRDYTERIHLGAEYLFHGLALRAGYKFNYDEEDFSAGFGINKNIGGSVLKIDYAFTSFGIFNAVQRFSIGFSF